jgi:hypothetical protein
MTETADTGPVFTTISERVYAGEWTFLLINTPLLTQSGYLKRLRYAFIKFIPLSENNEDSRRKWVFDARYVLHFLSRRVLESLILLETITSMTKFYVPLPRSKLSDIIGADSALSMILDRMIVANISDLLATFEGFASGTSNHLKASKAWDKYGLSELPVCTREEVNSIVIEARVDPYAAVEWRSSRDPYNDHPDFYNGRCSFNYDLNEWESDHRDSSSDSSAEAHPESDSDPDPDPDPDAAWSDSGSELLDFRAMRRKREEGGKRKRAAATGRRISRRTSRRTSNTERQRFPR